MLTGSKRKAKKKCKHLWTVSIYDEATGQEFSRRCSGCGEQMSLGPDTPGGPDAWFEFTAAWLIAGFSNGEVRMTNGEAAGYGNDSNSPFAGSSAWYAGWLARAWVDHEELQRQRDPGLVSDLVTDLEAAGGTQLYPGGPCATASPEKPERPSAILDEAYALGLADGTDGRTSRSEMVDRADDDPLCIAYALGYCDGSRARLSEDGAP